MFGKPLKQCEEYEAAAKAFVQDGKEKELAELLDSFIQLNKESR